MATASVEDVKPVNGQAKANGTTASTAASTSNKPTQSSNTNGSTSTGDEATRGRPFYEKLRLDLKATIEEKRKLDKEIAKIEGTISRLENQYLEETLVAGNIIKGFDNYIKASTASSGMGGAGGGTGSLGGTSTRRKGGVSDQDRIFSRSSVSWMMKDSPMPLLGGNHSPATTPSHTGTPTAISGAAHLQSRTGTPSSTGGPGTKASLKKGKKVAAGDKDKDDMSTDERPTKRGKVSWGRD